MKIALLSTGFLNGKEATAITLTDFSNELSNQNNQVTIISEMRKETVRYENINGCEVYRIGFAGQKKYFKQFSPYNRILAHSLAIRKMQNKSKEKFDVIHSFSAAPIMALRTAFSRFFNRKALTIHTLKSYSREKIGSSLFKVLNYVDFVTVPTKIFANLLIEKGVKRNKIRIIKSHININRFIPRNKIELKEKYGFTNKKIILYYGSMWKLKGTDILMQALPKVIEKNNEVIFIFAPRNLPYANKYNDGLDKYKNKVVMIKENVKIEEYVAMADVVVLPYPNLVGTEGNPSCMLEAMACKTAVVTTNLPELKEIANGEVYMAEPSNVDSLITNILDAVENPSLEMIEKAYIKAQKFSVEKISKQYLDLYQEHRKH
jgi:glycosyltransferase involved in cell wall biosynthesis